MTPALKARLLGSIHAGRLVVMCGAGLSMAGRSNLPSAQELANRCFDTASAIDSTIAPSIRDDLEGVADHFADSGQLVTVFIRQIVPWEDLVAAPNAGHQAIADLLLTAGADHGISTNCDQLIERSAWEFGADFMASLDGIQANLHSVSHRPLLKVHGCCNLDRDNTVWTRRQMTTEPIQTRIRDSTAWLTANLREKDVVVVGFWSDWAYLNELLETCLVSAHPTTVVVVDPAPVADLETKAPGLWRVFHAAGVDFLHEQASGADVLNELRAEFSCAYLRVMLMSGKSAFEVRFATTCPPAWLDTHGLSIEDLYALRRDAEGQPVGRPARLRSPRGDCQNIAFFHLALRQLGAVPEGSLYRFNDALIRVVNGAGRWLPEMQGDYSREVPVPPEADIVFCVGADDHGVPAHIVRSGIPSTTLRPAPRGKWLDSAGARAILGL